MATRMLSMIDVGEVRVFYRILTPFSSSDVVKLSFYDYDCTDARERSVRR